MRKRMQEEMAKGNYSFSHFGADANLFLELEKLFRTYGENGTGKHRKYLHNAA